MQCHCKDMTLRIWRRYMSMIQHSTWSQAPKVSELSRIQGIEKFCYILRIKINFALIIVEGLWFRMFWRTTRIWVPICLAWLVRRYINIAWRRSLFFPVFNFPSRLQGVHEWLVSKIAKFNNFFRLSGWAYLVYIFKWVNAPYG